MTFETYTMSFETYTNRLVKRLEHLCYASRKYGKYLSFYLPNYPDTNEFIYLFSIYYGNNTVRYVEDINDTFWSFIDYYDYESLEHLYNLAKNFVIKAKKLQIEARILHRFTEE